ncbi:MAG: site-2 protease family protein [Planctomycetota bacterium]|jgi:regulator of sigma E protease
MSEQKGRKKNYFRVFLIAVCAAAVIYFIVRNVGTFGNILLTVVGFGTVVFVHEFGHFIVAKLSGIKVEAFSFGFPPTFLGILRTEQGYQIRILPGILSKDRNGEEDKTKDETERDSLLSFTIAKKAKAGETEYRIGLIPFGGYVKMLGQEDTKAAEAIDDPRSYANKPVGIRMGVIAAGVCFNAVGAVILFMAAFLIGIKLPPAVVGGVGEDSPAARVGLKGGDEIIEIDGEGDNLDFSNIGLAAALSDVNEVISLKVQHEDGSIKDFEVVAKKMDDAPIKVFGIMQPQSLTIAELSKSDANDLRAKTGLMPGDRIKSVNGKDVQAHWELAEIVRNTFARSVVLLAEREGADGKSELVESEIRLSLSHIEKKVKSESDLSHIYSMVPRLRIDAVSPGRVSIKDRLKSLFVKKGVEKKEVEEKPCLMRGDIILAIGDVENPTYKELRDVVEEYEDRELAVKVLRSDANGVEKHIAITVVPRREQDDRVVIGFYLSLDAEHPVVAKTILTEDGPEALAIPRGAMIETVDGVEVASFYDCLKQLNRNAGERVSIDWRVDEEVAGQVVLDVCEGTEFVTVKSAFAEIVPFKRLEKLYKATGPIDAIGMGYKKTVMFVVQSYVTLKRVIRGLISPKLLMGPVGIIAHSYYIVAHRPLIYYVYFLGLINACIAVFNLMPFLPFDGGHIVFLLVEKIKGSAVNERVQGAVAYAGLALVCLLLLYITFNDIIRSFFS